MPEQYIVPQFLTVEPKIIGPITMRQFLWMLGSAFLLMILWRLLTFVAFIVAAVFILAIAGAFAFLKVNGLPFHFFLINVLQTIKRPRVRVWSKAYNDIELKQFMNRKPPEEIPMPKPRPRPSESRLAQLALVVNTGGAFNPDEEEVLQPYKPIVNIIKK